MLQGNKKIYFYVQLHKFEGLITKEIKKFIHELRLKGVITYFMIIATFIWPKHNGVWCFIMELTEVGCMLPMCEQL
jgi:hypothetical protein